MKKLFPTIVVLMCTIQSIAQTQDFERFPWGTNSTQVKTQESLPFKEKTPNMFSPAEFSLSYAAMYGIVEFEIIYTFEYNELLRISFKPVRKHPKAYDSAPKKKFVPTDFKTAHAEFITIQKLIVKNIASEYSEHAGAQMSLAQPIDSSTSPIIGDNYSSSLQRIQVLKLSILPVDSEYDFFVYAQKWVNPATKTKYTLGMSHWGDDMWNWHLNVYSSE